jgi:hypothetical protein
VIHAFEFDGELSAVHFAHGTSVAGHTQHFICLQPV